MVRNASDICIALTDAELVEEVYAIVDIDDPDGVDPLRFLLDELLERLAPDLIRADSIRRMADDDPDELLDVLDGLRRRQAARLLRDALN